MDAMFGHVWSRYHDQETILHQSLSDDRRQRLHGSWTRSGKNQLSACGLQRYSSKITPVLYMRVKTLLSGLIWILIVQIEIFFTQTIPKIPYFSVFSVSLAVRCLH